MKVPTIEEIKQTLCIPEIQLTRNRGRIRGDIITPAQRLVKDRIKIKINKDVQEQLDNRTIRKKSKWDV
ncbi:MAG TPA: hypothetical protein DCE52_02245 [Rhodobacteraceae bacterium]|nr:hypothetical protein [Paracoccaceae bacterium]